MNTIEMRLNKSVARKCGGCRAVLIRNALAFLPLQTKERENCCDFQARHDGIFIHFLNGFLLVVIKTYLLRTDL